MELIQFVTAAGEWNKLRYPQVFDLALTLTLLKEELNEYYAAEVAIEGIDAAIDLAFVAAGAIWKSGYPLCEESLKSIITFNEELHMQMAFHDSIEGSIRNMLVMRGSYIAVGNLYQIIGACYVHVCAILNSEALAKKAFEAIVVSNNTKTAQVIAIGEKYSSEGKGQSYVPPTETLKLIIAEAKQNGQKLY